MAVVTPGKPLLSAPLGRVHCEDSPAAAEAAIMLQVLRLAGSPLSQCAERYKGHSLLSARVMQFRYWFGKLGCAIEQSLGSTFSSRSS